MLGNPRTCKVCHTVTTGNIKVISRNVDMQKWRIDISKSAAFLGSWGSLED